MFQAITRTPIRQFHAIFRAMSTSSGEMSQLSQLLAALDAEMPFSGAAKWDNVGLLVEPPAAHSPTAPGDVFGVLFTNDITPAVLAEAASAFDGRPARAIVSYHPTPFSPLKKFTLATPAARVVLECAALNMAVIAPHTAWDAAPGGLNDWLLTGVVAALPGYVGAGAACSAISPIKRAEGDAGLRGAGDGRVGVLTEPVTLADVIDAVKAHLRLDTVQVSLPAGEAGAAAASAGAAAVAAAAAAIPVRGIAVCAGSGAGVLNGFDGADVWITGEMSHHELLSAAAAGVSVVLTHHSRCERGFLPIVIERIKVRLAGGGFQFGTAELDADPLTTL